jgi:hypothetical protein
MLGAIFREQLQREREAELAAAVLRQHPAVQAEYSRFAPIARRLTTEAFAALTLVVQDEAKRRDDHGD